MKILEIYEKYQIMPQLQEHQLRVAGVAGVICENFNPLPIRLSLRAGSNPPHKGEGTASIDGMNIVKACLLHDMGNILKFDLKKSHIFLKKEIDVEFWEKVKEEYREKYGSDEHQASLEIAKEIGVSQRVLELIDCIEFSKVEENLNSTDFGKKICEYSDDRVGFLGVMSMEERFADLRARYAHRHTQWGAEEARQKFETSVREIEKQIFIHCNIKPEDITETLILVTKKKLTDLEI